jgi:hypothetical protein
MISQVLRRLELVKRHKSDMHIDDLLKRALRCDAVPCSALVQKVKGRSKRTCSN